MGRGGRGAAQAGAGVCRAVGGTGALSPRRSPREAAGLPHPAPTEALLGEAGVAPDRARPHPFSPGSASQHVHTQLRAGCKLSPGCQERQTHPASSAPTRPLPRPPQHSVGPAGKGQAGDRQSEAGGGPEIPGLGRQRPAVRPPEFDCQPRPMFSPRGEQLFPAQTKGSLCSPGTCPGRELLGDRKGSPARGGGGDRAALAAGGSPGLPLTGRRHQLPVPARGHAGPAGVRGGPFPMPRSPPSLSSWGPFRGFGGPPLLGEVLAPRCQVSTPEQTDISLGSEDLGCRVSGG